MPPEGKLHVISKRYTQRIERHNLNEAAPGTAGTGECWSFSKSVELHEQSYWALSNIKHYQ
ncbi:IS1 family transposase [Escherichia coli]